MATNLQIKFIKSLQLKKNRTEHRMYVCEGEKIVEELLNSKSEEIASIFANEEWISSHPQTHIELVPTSQKEMEKMTSLSSPSPVLALMKMRTNKAKNILQQPLYIYLDRIADPGNLGTIIRTADWYGLRQIFLSPQSVDSYSHKVIQSTMGSHARVECLEIDFKDILQLYTFSEIYATAMQGESIDDTKPKSNSLLVLGSESHGITESIFAQSTRRVTIPRLGGAESLNVSVATGIILHSWIKS